MIRAFRAPPKLESMVDDEEDTILTDDHPTLKKTSLPVTEFGAPLELLVDRLLTAMRANRGRGLAAVQIGVLERVIVAYADKKTFIMVNPVITRSLNRLTVEREGCLSVRVSKWRDVKRPAKCEISWQDVSGKTHSGNFSGEPARVLQHEIDHLDGILITDKEIV